ncbi:DNA polymerase III subunit alpha [bacterium]|nr:DNA polymerase III subunit alpha [bacterium]
MSINIESSYSFNGSLIRKEDLVYFKDYGYKELGLVDNNTAFFVMFYKELISLNIKPILGYRVKGSLYDYILYAKNYDGYKDILSFASSINNKFPVSFSSIIKSKNIYYCLDLSYFESTDLSDIDKEYNILKDSNLDVTLGVDFEFYPCEALIYPLVKDKYNAIIIQKVKYIHREDKKASEILESILTGKELKESNLFDTLYESSYHLKTYDEFLHEYKEYDSLINSTKAFTSSLNVTIEFSKHFPIYPSRKDIPADIYLKKLSYKGLSRRLEGTQKDTRTYKERLDYELNIIREMGFSDYFLVVYDYILYAKKHNIYVGPGRGSAASSLVSYSLGIVDIDPIEFDLYFERFLNPERATMPDIDTDFEDIKRDDVIKYVVEKYGENRVALISTFQTFLAKSAIRDVSKYFDIPDLIIAHISKIVDESNNSLKKVLENKTIMKMMIDDIDISKMLTIAAKIEGLPRSTGTHAAGVIISDQDLTEYSEVHIGLNNFKQTTYDSDTLKEVGLLKMDFLSLRNLTILHEIVSDIERNNNFKLDLNSIPLDDKKTFKLLREKSTSGIFQFESPGMTRLIKDMKIDNFKDLSISIALFRPGPMDNIKEFIERKENKSKITYYDECLKGILAETRGIIVYQEQIMAIVSTYSGLTKAEGDNFRRAMSSKNQELILSLKDKFFSGAASLNRDPKNTELLFNDILKFSGYGFNKSHSVAYSKISYYLAYLKANYSKEFMANLLSNSPASLSNKYIKEAIDLSIKVLPPDIRFSSFRYKVYKDKIYMPLTSIKGIGYDYTKLIMKIRDDNNISFELFVNKSKDLIPREIIEDLIFSGAFDYTSYNKNTMISSLDGLYEFDTALVKGLKGSKVLKLDEYDFDYLKIKEYELLGFNPKYHPIKKYTGDYPKISDIELGQNNIQIVAYLSNLKIIKTKTGDSMAHFYLEDEYMIRKGVLFSKDYYKCAHYLKTNTIYIVSGSYKENKNEPEFIVRELKNIDV